MIALRASLAFAVSTLAVQAQAAETPLSVLINDVVKLQLDYDPTRAYGSGLPATDHVRLPDRRPAAFAAYAKREDQLLARLGEIDPSRLSEGDQAQYAIVREHLEANRGLRVCRAELWAVDHLSGWQTSIPALGDVQPVGSPAARAAALQRWAEIPSLIAVEIDNAREGLAKGYSTPKSVVARVIGQVDRLASAKVEESPFFAPAKRDGDPAFEAELRRLIVEQINPAISGYKKFLESEYLPRARDSLGIGALPDGEACYRASLRYYTTLDRSPKAVFELGKATVDENMRRVREIGRKRFGTEDLRTIVSRTAEAPDNRFSSEEEVVSFSRAQVARGREKSRDVFARMPAQDVIVEPIPPYMRGAGVSAHYNAEPDPTKPGVYRIVLDNWRTMTRADAQITAFHEAWPGHHFQVATAWSAPTNDLAKLVSNAAYVEGWARYSERLSEEIGLIDNDYSKIMRRMWPARGMVVDPGLHVLGWTREQAEAYVVESGRFPPEDAKHVVDRIAVLPGQATAYDVGGLEIFALRAEAEKALGSRFDLKEFHAVILEGGMIPLAELRHRLEAWIAAQLSPASPSKISG